MKDKAIIVEGLGKKYRLGQETKSKRYKTIQEEIINFPKRFLKNLKTDITEFWALKDVSFEVKQGEVLGIIGRNGAGKSTLLKILSRITDPTEGHIDIYGRVGSLLEVGTGFHPELTGRENIYLSGAILGLKRWEINNKFDEIVQFSEIESFLDTPSKHYSSGMYMRLAFSVAAHLEPEILVVDEVLAVGDMAFQKKCLGKMQEVSKDGRTILFVSHDMGAIIRICSRAIIMKDGKTVFDDIPTNAINEYSKLIEDNHQLTTSVYHYESITLDERLKIFKINRVEILNSADGRFTVHWQEAIKLMVEFQISEDILDLVFGFGLKTQTGQYLFVNHCNFQKDLDIEKLLTGRHSIIVECPGFLSPGIYSIVLGAEHNIGHENIFHFESLNLKILEYSIDGMTKGLNLPGYFNIPVQFQILT